MPVDQQVSMSIYAHVIHHHHIIDFAAMQISRHIMAGGCILFCYPSHLLAWPEDIDLLQAVLQLKVVDPL